MPSRAKRAGKASTGVEIPIQQELRIEAEPTKDFFISMLVKDVTVVAAILDLVDNSIDGARRLRKRGDFKGLWVKITLGENQFEITDNCGGIDLNTARHYAFRFGRPASAKPTPNSIGQFGVGMKRALFKLGRRFVIKSTSAESQFSVSETVDEWRERDKWDFSLVMSDLSCKKEWV